MKKYIIRLIVLVLIVAGIFSLIRFTPVGDYLNLQRLQENKEALKEFVERNYLVAVLVYIALYIVVVALSIPGATWLTLLGGFFFGVIFATIFINIGATIGATIVFLAARFFLGEMIQNKYGEKLAKFNREVETNGSNYLITLRLIPLFPFWMINLFAGVTKIKPRTFIWTTSLGIIPGSAVYAYAGYAINDIGEGGVPKNIIFALLLLALLSAVPLIVKKVRIRRGRQAEQIGDAREAVQANSVSEAGNPTEASAAQ
ncbi:MAG: TVP38/TMEM64 family protein [Spirochaetaceae bacterium]|nr:MAG: TVP38/TMEM64 family protein [Spirochaetaceae bacterium]